MAFLTKEIQATQIKYVLNFNGYQSSGEPTHTLHIGDNLGFEPSPTTDTGITTSGFIFVFYLPRQHPEKWIRAVSKSMNGSVTNSGFMRIEADTTVSIPTTIPSNYNN